VIGQQALGQPNSLAFIGGAPDGAVTATAQPNETFLIADGANALIENFSIANGDTLDVRALLNGAPVAADLANLGSFVSVSGAHADPSGNGTDTVLTIQGPGGRGSLSLQGSAPVTLSELVNGKALLLPPH
jgi:hypothetical protein